MNQIQDLQEQLNRLRRQTSAADGNGAAKNSVFDLVLTLALAGRWRCGLGRGVGGLGGPRAGVDGRWRLCCGAVVGGPFAGARTSVFQRSLSLLVRWVAAWGCGGGRASAWASSGRGPLQQACGFTVVKVMVGCSVVSRRPLRSRAVAGVLQRVRVGLGPALASRAPSPPAAAAAAWRGRGRVPIAGWSLGGVGPDRNLRGEGRRGW
jgi:hypothetical protein